MQCFICITYLVIFCKALPYEDRPMSPIINNATLPANEMDAGPQAKVEMDIPAAAGQFPNRTQINESENNSQIDDKTKIDHKTTKPPEESAATTCKPPSAAANESMLSGINKDYIKYMITGLKGSDQLFRPILNEMEDMSQIGDSDRLTIINPTVIVNFRGTIWNRDSDVKLGQRKKDKRKPENTFD